MFRVGKMAGLSSYEKITIAPADAKCTPLTLHNRRMPNPLTSIPPRRAAQYGLAFITATLALWIFMQAGNAMTPFIIGLVVTWLLGSIVNRLAAFMPRWAAVFIVYATCALVFGLLLVFLVPAFVNQVQRLRANIPSLEALQRWSTQRVADYHTITPDALEPLVEQGLHSVLTSLQSNFSTLVRNALSFAIGQITHLIGILTFLLGLFILPIWVFYLLNEQKKVVTFLNHLMKFQLRADVWHIWRVIDRSLSAYLRGQLTLGAIIGIAVGCSLSIADLVPGIEIDYILLLALWAGLCELIPMVGALLGLIPGVIVAFVLGGPVSGIVVAIIYIVIQQIENNLLVPRVIGNAVGVHPAILTVTLVAGASIFGLPGVILAAPTTAITRDLYLYAYRRLGGATADEAMKSIS